MDPVALDVLKKKQTHKKKSLLLAARLVLEQGTHLDPVTRVVPSKRLTSDTFLRKTQIKNS